MLTGMWQRVCVSGSAGTVLGYLCARVVLVGSGAALVPWGVVGIALGIGCTRRAAVLVGSAYGFALAYVFMLASYDGSADRASRLLPFLAFGAFGALCGSVLALLGRLVSRRSSRAGTAAPARPEPDAERGR
jgi:hypothetical protein